MTKYDDIDTYHMVAGGVEEGFRQVVAVGGDPHQVGGVDNFYWPSIQYDPVENPDGRYKAAQLVRADWALHDACLALGVPLLSGKDSMYVDGKLKGHHGLVQRVSSPPTMAPVPDLRRLQSLEPKLAGDLVYVTGPDRRRAGRRCALQPAGLHRGQSAGNQLRTVAANIPGALHGPGRRPGRVGVGLRGQPGRAGLRLGPHGHGLGPGAGPGPARRHAGAFPLRKLFTESTGRLVITVAPANAVKFESLLDGISWAKVGRVKVGGRLLVHAGEAAVLVLKVGEIRKAFTQRFGGLI